jgi:ribonuclease D
MADLPIRRYEGAVCVVSTAADLEHAARDLAQETVVGFDTETRPAFSKGESYLPCLVQVATAQCVYLFRFRGVDVVPLLKNLLERPDLVKSGVSVGEDLRALKQVFPFEPRSVVDLGHVARACGYGQSGVRNLAGIFMGVRIPKGAQTSNWAASRLTPAQVTYAATDAWICRELYLRFQAVGLGA